MTSWGEPRFVHALHGLWGKRKKCKSLPPFPHLLPYVPPYSRPVQRNLDYFKVFVRFVYCCKGSIALYRVCSERFSFTIQFLWQQSIISFSEYDCVTDWKMHISINHWLNIVETAVEVWYSREKVSSVQVRNVLLELKWKYEVINRTDMCLKCAFTGLI